MLINFIGLIVSIIAIIGYLYSITTEDTSEPCTGFEISVVMFIGSLLSYFFYSLVWDCVSWLL
jgi:predicted membrane channel-forming protein YqfA (hemolysin III family)